MNIPVTQRWRSGRASYRPAGETINTLRYEVAAIDKDGPAKAFVVKHHYSGKYPAARFRFGLWRKGGVLEGVAVFSVPANDAALKVLPCDTEESVELGRFVLLDEVKANGETWFLARCFELLLRKGLGGVLSFSDPVARSSGTGEVVFPGHLGIIYRAHNARYLGRATARTLHLLPDGRAVSPRALQKVRTRERGWRYAVAELETAGARPLHPSEDSRAWLREQLPRVTRTLRHGGNLRYLWGLRDDVKRRLPAGFKYPSWGELGMQLTLEGTLATHQRREQGR